MDMERWGEDEGMFLDAEMPMPFENGEWEEVEDGFEMDNENQGRGRFPNITVIPIIPGVTTPGGGGGGGQSFLRFFNANASVGPVDIYVNGRMMAQNLPYKKFTAYKRANAGTYRVTVYSAGTLRNPLRMERVTVRNGQIYTMAVVGTKQDVSLEVVRDSKRQLNPIQSIARMIQFSPNAPTMDVYMDGRLVIQDLDYREISRYLNLFPGKHNLVLKIAGTNRILLEEPSVMLRSGKAYSIYIVGNVNERPGLQVIVSMEGTSYLG